MSLRRAVTTVRGGQSAVLHDGAPVKIFGGGGYEFAEVWSTAAPAPAFEDDSDRTSGFDAFTTELATGESRFRLVTFPAGMDAPMHATPTIDYGVVLSGAIVLELEDGSETELRAGDAFVQRGVVHAWHNRTDQPFRMAVVMIGAAGSAAH
jgi:quercetin dioxygenase-like cupin family protein